MSEFVLKCFAAFGIVAFLCAVIVVAFAMLSDGAHTGATRTAHERGAVRDDLADEIDEAVRGVDERGAA